MDRVEWRRFLRTAEATQAIVCVEMTKFCEIIVIVCSIVPSCYRENPSKPVTNLYHILTNTTAIHHQTSQKDTVGGHFEWHKGDLKGDDSEIRRVDSRTVGAPFR